MGWATKDGNIPIGKDKIDNMNAKVEIMHKGIRCAFVDNMVNYL
jgi:hypothetical protein